MKFTRLNRRQIDQLSSIAADAGLVSLATVVLPALLDKVDLNQIVLGLIVTLILWAISLWLKK